MTMTADEFKTAGERERWALAGELLGFLARLESLQDFTSDPEAVDLDNPKASLLRHSEVRKSIHLFAYLSTIEQKFRLDNFNVLCPAEYLAELESELKNCLTAEAEDRIKNRISAFNFLRSKFSGTSDIREAATNKANVEAARNSLLILCRSIVTRWIEKHPSPTLTRLAVELQKLQTERASCLVWFGLGDFINL